jgi:hypothetical protein
VNVQQFNKDFARDFFNTTHGARWKVAGSPNGRGGLEYLGEDVRDYELIYRVLLANEINADTRKLDSFEAFEQSVAGGPPATTEEGFRAAASLKSFADQRRAFLFKKIAP